MFLKSVTAYYYSFLFFFSSLLHHDWKQRWWWWGWREDQYWRWWWWRLLHPPHLSNILLNNPIVRSSVFEEEASLHDDDDNPRSACLFIHPPHIRCTHLLHSGQFFDVRPIIIIIIRIQFFSFIVPHLSSQHISSASHRLKFWRWSTSSSSPWIGVPSALSFFILLLLLCPSRWSPSNLIMKACSLHSSQHHSWLDWNNEAFTIHSFIRKSQVMKSILPFGSSQKSWWTIMKRRM